MKSDSESSCSSVHKQSRLSHEKGFFRQWVNIWDRFEMRRLSQGYGGEFCFQIRKDKLKLEKRISEHIFVYCISLFFLRSNATFNDHH